MLYLRKTTGSKYLLYKLDPEFEVTQKLAYYVNIIENLKIKHLHNGVSKNIGALKQKKRCTDEYNYNEA